MTDDHCIRVVLIGQWSRWIALLDEHDRADAEVEIGSMDDPRPDDLIRRRHRRRAAAADHGAATSIATTGTKRDRPAVIADVGARVPVTEPEIRLVVAMLGGVLDRILDADHADGSV